MKISKNAILGIVIAAVVVVVLVLAFTLKRGGAPEPASPEESTPGAVISEPAAHAGRSYEEALQIYTESGYRFQFSNCSGTPGSLAMKQGTTFMLDNRDAEAHTFVVGSQTYRLGAYGFAIATARTIGTYNITCDGGGAAQLVVQP